MKITLPGFILALAVAVAGCGYTPSPEAEATKETLKEIVGALDAFKKDNKRYPQALADLVTKPKYLDPKTTKWPANGYMKAIPKDAWNKDFFYRMPGTSGHPYDVISMGEDGKFGGKKDAQDISCWPPAVKK